MKYYRILIFTLLMPFCLNLVAQDLVLQNVNVIDVEDSEVKMNQDVAIRNGIIKSISSYNSKKKWGNSTIVDCKGKFLMPGFIDSHAHISMGPVVVEFEDKKPLLVLKPSQELTDISIDLLLEHGVTSIRDPGGNTEIMVRTKRAIENKEILGPELFIAGYVIDTVEFKNLTAQVKNEDELRREIRRQKEAGVDIIKLYTSLSPSMIKAGIEEAHKLGLLSTAHLYTTSWIEAANLGIDNIVHIIPGNDSALPDSKKAEYAAALGTKAFYKWFELVDLESEKVQELIKALKKNNVSIDPTLVPFHAAFFGNTGEYQANTMLDELPKEMTENWKTSFNFNIGWTDIDFQKAQKSWSKVQKFTKMLYDNGILLTAGTDANNPWTVPGDSFHKELVLLKECGIPTWDVLRIATLNGAKIVKADKRIGSIKVGKEADLVLLDKNPVDDIHATRSIKMVISNGEVIPLKK